MASIATPRGSVSSPPGHAISPQTAWVVELNIAGCRILRWAQKRRHLLRPPGLPGRAPEVL